jgi:hypothetical protein
VLKTHWEEVLFCRNVIEIEDRNNKYDIEMAISDLYKRIAKLYND